MDKKSPVTTVGTSGKVFTNAPGDWKPFPRLTIADWESPIRKTSAASVPGSHTALSPLARFIDHTLLKPEATEVELRQLCEEARAHHFFSVCINPNYVKRAKEFLKGSEVKVCTVAGFPLGASETPVKSFEAAKAVENGADEVDMVIQVGLLKSKKFKEVAEDISAVRKATAGRTLKVILENCLLTQEEKVRACQLVQEAGADFVKTSTGFSKSGATVEDIRLMRQTVGPAMGVKAAGGVRDAAFAEALILAGATRLGTSASVALIQGKAASLPY